MSLNSPTIPAKFAEKLYVTLGVTIQEIAKRTDYPVEVLETILETYRADADKYMTGNGWDAPDIRAVTESALQELNVFLEDRQFDSAGDDFAMWRNELGVSNE